MTIEALLTPDELRHDLKDAGVSIFAENADAADLAQAAVYNTPNLVIAASVSPSNLLFEAARLVGILAPARSSCSRPIVALK